MSWLDDSKVWAQNGKSLSPQIESILTDIDSELRSREQANQERAINSDAVQETRARLEHMSDLDQYIRRQFGRSRGLPEDQKETFRQEVSKRATRIDAKNARTLTTLLEEEGGWFTISKYGNQTAIQAFTLVQHADNHPELQTHVLELMRPLSEKGEASPSLVAYLHDRVCFNQGVPQRYGTQGGCNESGTWVPHEIEVPEEVDKRRSEVGLPPLADYIRGFQGLCQ